jgi:hypothetical protein
MEPDGGPNLLLAASSVAPVATQPGRSGTQAEQLPVAFSITTAGNSNTAGTGGFGLGSTPKSKQPGHRRRSYVGAGAASSGGATGSCAQRHSARALSMRRNVAVSRARSRMRPLAEAQA